MIRTHVPKKRKHLSRAHRAAIRRGLRRYYRRERRQRAKRNARRRERDRLRRQQAKLPKKLPKRETVEWEVTLRYSAKGKAIGWTARVIAPRWATREQVIIVTRRAGQHLDERGFRVHWNNWQAEGRGGHVTDYPAYDPADVPGWIALFDAAYADGDVRAERVKP